MDEAESREHPLASASGQNPLMPKSRSIEDTRRQTLRLVCGDANMTTSELSTSKVSQRRGSQTGGFAA